MKKTLKLYVWEGVLCDWSCGVAVALAYDVGHARRLIKAQIPYETNEFDRDPQIYTNPTAVTCNGGG